MAIMCALMVELLCHEVMERIPALKCLLLDTLGRLWLRLVLFGIKWPRYLRILTLGSLARYW
jgi:hypothetical protein